jgi:hypothetical protein
MDALLGFRKKILADSMALFLAVIIAFFALTILAANKTDLENLAKGEQNTSRFEAYEGKQFTAYNIKDMNSLIIDREKNGSQDLLNKKSDFHRLLWLGNSQLHYINQFQDGDHLSPYWLRNYLQKEHSIEPLGFSLANANLQELFILSLYATSKIPVDLIMIELCFNNLRDDELRDVFSEILSPQVAFVLSKSTPAADHIIKRFLSITEENSKAIQAKTAQKPGDILSGTVQKPVENWINSRLTSWWSLWANRPQIEGNVLTELWDFRNWVFNINATTVRKMIPSRYSNNMEALKGLVDYYRHKGIPVLLYFPPIRQDKPMPYDTMEYERWKKEVAVMTQAGGVHLVNLEKLVPPEYWGSYVENEIDFMHFRNGGHQLVAKALAPYIEQVLARKKADVF